MGVVFLEHPNGPRYYCCKTCHSTPLTNRSEIMSTRFQGATGRAYLFRSCINVRLLKAETRMMITGRHKVRDVVCKLCSVKLGWWYEFATEEDQRYKEGHFILERDLIEEQTGLVESSDTSVDQNDQYM
ncbi:putative Protein yippee [Hypsibius exemplaris]|uniref:Protein yippee-like n=1 Tax=Hypsibius exemplaris TaxID=2072580 RepID=A0A1W0WTB7_HYPEX|nr:putative Protein yippee [Hypsibius exemplaris]